MLSVALVALGVVYLNDTWWPKRYVGTAFVHMPIFLIILGCLSFIASLVGCYVTRIKNRRSLIIVSDLNFQLTL